MQPDSSFSRDRIQRLNNWKLTMKNYIIILLCLSLIHSKEKEQLFYTVYYNDINRFNTNDERKV